MGKDAQNAITNIESIKNDIAKLKIEIVTTKKQISKFELTSIDSKIDYFKTTIEDELEKINSIFSDIADRRTPGRLDGAG